MSPVTRFGLTWWGQRWIAALEALGAAYENRLPRGRTYARKGAVTDLTVAAGEVTAHVAGTRPRPYRVELRLPVFDDVTWEAVTAALAARVRHAAQLLDGRVPDDIDEVLGECGVSLFPTARELTTRCSCPDEANPCKHVAAVHYVLAQTFDADPFLLPTLRGRDRATLLAALRAHRAGGEPPPDETEAVAGPVPIGSLVARELYAADEQAVDVVVRPRPPEDPEAVLRRLGPPPGLASAGGPLQAAVRDAAGVAWALLDGDADVVRSTLLRLGPTSARGLADVLGLPIAEVRSRLRALRDDGQVTTSGRGPGTRYHLRR